ncbi:MAG: DNA topoisomerase IV subunit B [Pseudomonadales bacterium]|jgi:topoisomerase-4 subunit B|nr:DNA topoisomerase IV subunit B [Pseudomonadales bacterium]MDC1084663.1 DNA topoisomerase IV subunit B [Pseudomonadales bacterium]MDC6450190.1 DNA topoisomerase IV subunit B [Pseudomonadales bacterium]MDG1000160.1 DNA topoisomerase IV subunit B [Pseudomonadales bacterium]MDG1305471.1 DNA topoisomerase IV subunit B [Pseudomonadales bacterium]|tara:strand:- start:3959 stop:5863 length:1905 start_codon:yes stop_codon:yes gene_type:complete
MANNSYKADSIEVLEGLDPVRKRPGMYTDTTRPNHLAQEVIDNSVDEALEGYANEIRVTLRKDGSMSVGDNGRGMPVDIHKKEKVSGVELILSRLHSGAKFNSDNYKFSGGLHGVGVSVVNALSLQFEVYIKRDGKLHHMGFKNGNKSKDLAVKDSVGKRNTGTLINFTPDPQYFDSPKFSVSKMKHLLKAKAVLCPGLRVFFTDETASKEEEKSYEWFYETGLKDYLIHELGDHEVLPAEPFLGSVSGNDEAVDWAVQWLPEGGELVTESYVNLIPTAQGGTHVNGLRSGLLEALREFCDFRNMVPRGVKISADDIWDRCAHVLSAKMLEPQFAGQTKERLNSRQAATFISGVVKDSFSLWLNQHVAEAELIAELAINNAQARLRAGKKVARKKVTSGPALPGKLADCSCQDAMQGELFLVEGDSAGGSAKQARDRETQAIMPLRGKILNTWEVDSSEILASQEVHDISVALGIDPASPDLSGLRYGKICILADADSDGLHIASLLIALFVKHFPALVENGHVFVAMPPLYRIDVGKEVFYALDESERQGYLDLIEAEKKKGKVTVQRFKGLGEMNPLQLRETAMNEETRRLVQLNMGSGSKVNETLDMLLSKKRAADRKSWLEEKGDQAEIL